MKALLTTIIASALLSAVYAQAPEGKGPRKGPQGPQGPQGPPPKEILEKFDKDGDGKLNEEERKAMMEGRKAEMLKRFDKDGDGTLSEEEKKAMMEGRKAEMLKRFDKDGDGTLSEEEKKAMHEAMGEHRPKKPRPEGAKKPE